MSKTRTSQGTPMAMAATATWQEGQAPSRSGGRPYSSNQQPQQQHFIGQAAMVFGDDSFYSFNHAAFQQPNNGQHQPQAHLQHPQQQPPPVDPNQPPLLSQEQNDLLQNFFDDPNQISIGQFGATDFFGNADEKSTATPSAIFATSFDPAGNTISPSDASSHAPSHHKAHVNAPPHDPSFSADVYSAASNLHNLKATSSPAFSPTNNAGFGASWGNFMMPTAMNSPMGNAMNNMNPSNFQSFIQHGRPNRMAGPNLQRQNSYGQQQSPPGMWQSQMASRGQQSVAPEDRSRQFSETSTEHVRSQQPDSISQYQPSVPPDPSAPTRATMIHFGSDQDFAGSRYHRPPSKTNLKAKENNLLQNPFAYQIVASSGSQRAAHSGPAAYDPNSTQVGGSTWGNMRIAPSGQAGSAHDYPEMQSRKRRKSYAEHDDEGEWEGDGMMAPGAKRGSKVEDTDDESEIRVSQKRRKSAYKRGQTGKSPPAAQDDDDADGDLSDGAAQRGNTKKARDTLSEAQKRDNHIKSEKKRRQIINKGYDDLNQLVPCLASGKSGLSRAECLQEVACYLESLVAGSQQMMSVFGLSEDAFARATDSRPGPSLVKSED